MKFSILFFIASASSFLGAMKGDDPVDKISKKKMTLCNSYTKGMSHSKQLLMARDENTDYISAHVSYIVSELLILVVKNQEKNAQKILDTLAQLDERVGKIEKQLEKK